jgi:WD40 repeat protein
LGCPTEDTLLALVEGRLAGESEATFRHVESCESCRLLMRELARSYGRDDEEPREGLALGRYRLVQRLGAGGMGVVWSAYDLELRRTVAIKFVTQLLSSDESTLARFKREARVAAALDHPNVGAVFDVGEHAGRPFIVMAFYDGESLRQRLERGALPLGETVSVLTAAAAGLACAHAAGVVHRDVKPANILLPSNGEVKVCDFGLAKPVGAVDTTVTVGSGLLGTVAYMAPEQLDGRPLDASADVWALGVTGVEMLGGARPFDEASPVRLAHAIAHDEPSLPPSLPRDLEIILRHCLHAEPSRRYRHAGELYDELRRFAAGLPIRARPESALGRLRRRAWRHRAVFATSAAALLLVLVVASVAVWRVSHARTQMSASREEVLLLEARAELGRDPTAAVERLRELAGDSPRWSAARVILDEARRLGVATRLRGHTREISRLAISADGHLLASASDDGTARLWDVGRGTSVVLRGHHGQVVRVALSRDGKRLATGASDGGIFVWDTASAVGRELRGHRDEVNELVFSADGDTLFSVSDDRTLRAWAVARGEGRTLAVLAAPAPTAALSPDGRWLALGVEDGSVELRAVAAAGTRTLRGHHGTVARVAFSPDGKQLASVGADGTARLWSLAGGEPRVFRAAGPLRRVALSSDGQWLAAGAIDGSILLVHPADGTSRIVRAHADQVAELAFSPDSRYLASSSRDGVVHVFEPATGDARQLRCDAGWVRSLVFAPDGSRLITGSADGTLRIWRVADWSDGQRIDAGDATVRDVAFTSDGRYVVWGADDGEVWSYEIFRSDRRLLGRHHGVVARVGASPVGGAVATASLDGTAALWHPASGEKSVLAHASPVEQAFFSGDGRTLYTNADDGAVRAWDLASGTAQTLFRQAPPGVELAVSGSTVAAGGPDFPLRVWIDGSTRVFAGATAEVAAVAISPRAQWVAAGDVTGAVHLWNVASGARRELAAHAGRVSAVAFSPDGAALASAGADERVRITPLGPGSARVLVARGTLHYDLEWSPDGSSIASSSDSGVELWDAATGESELLTGHRGHIFQIAWSPNGRYLASCSFDHTVRLWSVALAPSAAALRAAVDEIR